MKWIAVFFFLAHFTHANPLRNKPEHENLIQTIREERRQQAFLNHQLTNVISQIVNNTHSDLPNDYITIFRPGQLHQNTQQLRQAIQRLIAAGVQPTIILTSPYERTNETALLMAAYFPRTPIYSMDLLGQQGNESMEEYRQRMPNLLLQLARNHQRPLIIGHSHTVAAAYPNQQDFHSIMDGGFVIAASTSISRPSSITGYPTIPALTVYHRFSHGVALNPPNFTQSTH